MLSLRPRLRPPQRTTLPSLPRSIASSRWLRTLHDHEHPSARQRSVLRCSGTLPISLVHPRRPAGLLPRCPSLDARCLSTASLAAYLTPPAVFTGLVLTLWAYKCLMMIIFQNKIIYMPSVPPFSRSEKIEDYARECHGVQWREETIESMDGTRLALAVGDCGYLGGASGNDQSAKPNHLRIVYFQGNASSLPPRLPMLSSALRAICFGPYPISATLVAVSYRGFWKSAGRAAQPGIELDAQATVLWAYGMRQKKERDNITERSKLVLWGQSIGAGMATQAAANLLNARRERTSSPHVDALILETPFTSVRDMLVGLYPQKYLPYRYLWPFLRSSWDSRKALEAISKQQTLPKLLILNAEKDEVVPHDHGEILANLAQDLGYDLKKTSVEGALHHEATMKQEGRQALAVFCQSLVK